MTRFKRLIALTVALALSASPVTAAQLSPAGWPAGRLDQLEKREAGIWPTERRTLEGGQGMVSATASPVAVEAGMQALRQGGTAADAAIAASLTQIATMTGANVSYAGVAHLLYFEAKTGRVHALDAGWNSWSGERSPETIPAADVSLVTGKATDTASAQAGRKMLVPGFMAGMEAASRRFGKLAFGELFAPAIYYAEHGVPMTPLLQAYFPMAERHLSQTAEGRAFSHLPGAGQRIVIPGLASTLKAVARDGARAMYTGQWARDYVAAVRGAGGAATMADMAAYKVRWTEPLSTGFGDARVYGPGEPNFGGCAVLEALNLLGHRNDRDDAARFVATARAVRVGMLASYSPDAAAIEQRVLGMGGDCRTRLSPEFGAAAADRLDGLLDARPGSESTHHSASVVVVDRWGNVAALVHSSNTPLWGDTGMIVGGIPLPTPAGIFQRQLIGLAPGARLPSEIAPVIALRGGRPVLAAAGIGVSMMPETVRLVSRLLGGGDPAAVLGEPAMLSPFAELNMNGAREELIPAGGYPAPFLDAIRGAGGAVREVDAGRTMALRGTVALGLTGTGKHEAVEVPGVLVFGDAY